MRRMRENLPSVAADFLTSSFAADLVDMRVIHVQSSLILSQILKDIGFREVIDRWCLDKGDVSVGIVLEAYIHCRFNSADPVPLSRFQEWFSHSSLPHLLGVPVEKMNESRLGRCLERAGNAPQEMWIELIANAHRVYKFDLSYIINDTTSFYFEGEYVNSVLAKYGYSRDGKPECKQVNVSINVTGMHSIPLHYSVIPGNTADVTTVIPNARALCRLFKALGEPGKKVVVVADKGLLTMPLLHHYENVGIGWVGTMKCPTFEGGIIREVVDEDLQASPLAYLAARYKDNPKKKETERYCAIRRKVKLPAFEEDGVQYPDKHLNVLVVFSDGKKRLDQQKREDRLGKQESRLREISGFLNRGNYRSIEFAQNQVAKALSKYASTRNMIAGSVTCGDDGLLSLEWQRMPKTIEKAGFLDGKYLVYFSEEHLSDEAVFSLLKSRDRVEKRIETLKGPIVVRPIYLHKDARIRGLIFASMTALLLYGLAELLAMRSNKKITGEEIQKQFNDYTGSLISFSDGSQVVAFPHGNERQRSLHNAIGVQPGRRIIVRGPSQSEAEPQRLWIETNQTRRAVARGAD